MTEQQSTIEIRAVKLKRKGDEGFTPEIIVHDPELKLNRTYSDCENIAHADFTRAVARLNHHIAILTDKTEPVEFESNEEIDEIMFARGFSYSGAENELRVTLKGYQKTSRGGVFQINTPVVYLETEDDDKKYYFIDDLKEKLKRISLEARLYIFQGKRFEDPQLSLNMPDGDKVTKAKIATSIVGAIAGVVDDLNGEIEKGKGTPGRKKKPQTADNKKGE
jgi:hypothetical protein